MPIPKDYIDQPYWDGEHFILGTKRLLVLEYSENFAGWSDDLTFLHEKAVGANHPIDIASRNDALLQVQNIRPTYESVIMEIGCSSGYLIRDLKNKFSQCVIVGVDVVKEPLYQLAKSSKGIPLIRFDLLECPLPNESVDVLLMLNVLEHIEDDRRALRNAFNLLKLGGSLIIEVPAGRHLFDSYDEELNHFRRYSSNELINKLTNVGFKVVRKSHLGFFLFPAFAVIKLFNKFIHKFKLKSVTNVSHQATASSASNLIKWAMNFESKYMSKISLPFGIRVLVVASRP